jgi:ammonia channel protein AmtB
MTPTHAAEAAFAALLALTLTGQLGRAARTLYAAARLLLHNLKTVAAGVTLGVTAWIAWPALGALSHRGLLPVIAVASTLLALGALTAIALAVRRDTHYNLTTLAPAPHPTRNPDAHGDAWWKDTP